MVRIRSCIASLCCAMASAVVMLAAGCGSNESSPPTANLIGSAYRVAPQTKQYERLQFTLHPVVQVCTSAGDFALQLDAEKAPLTVDNFLTYVETGHYDRTIFHQVYDGFVVIGGGYDEHFHLRPTEPAVRNEAHNGLKNRRGTVAMARQADAVDSATSQFFINLADNTSLDFVGTKPSQYGYCVFGEVTSGMDVVDQIGKGEVHKTTDFDDVPVHPVVIRSIRRIK